MTDFYSLPTAGLENEYLTLEYLTHAGPRIVRLIPRRLGQNLFAETPRQQLQSPYGPFHLWGGHRLWHAPETAARTYIPDDGGLTVEPLPPSAEGEGVCLRYMEPYSGIHKEIRLRLAADAPRVTLTHRLTNLGLWPIELAPWAITQLKIGGTAVLPTPPESDPEALLPNRMIALWPYSRWDDPRLRLGESVIEVLAQPLATPFKIGYLNLAGWAEYRYEGVTFRKRWTPQPERRHADYGCNVEVYASERHLELETLGPLTRLEVGEMAEHIEVWEVEE
ncbi:MAG TPA: hypothetical protein PK829_10255 [Promineifilum sp.]|nr:hypothetical protein [Promineifilum sp.]HQF70241.1 hypothetical protein [Promineifilum sp.]